MARLLAARRAAGKLKVCKRPKAAIWMDCALPIAAVSRVADNNGVRLTLLLPLAAGLGCGVSAGASPQSERARMAVIVDRLGKPGTSFREYQALDTNRCIALPLLVSALAKLPPVEPGKVGGALGRPEDYLTARTEALLQALRALTAHDEYGPISRREYRALPTYREVPGGDGILQRDSLIAALPHGRSRFYAYWMSRGTFFYAPKATQRAIKAQWRRLVATFDCRKRLSKSRWDPSFLNG